jgi:hypothetical protein
MPSSPGGPSAISVPLGTCVIRIIRAEVVRIHRVPISAGYGCKCGAEPPSAPAPLSRANAYRAGPLSDTGWSSGLCHVGWACRWRPVSDSVHDDQNQLQRLSVLWNLSRHHRARWRNNRAENSHQPTRRRERKRGSRAPDQLSGSYPSTPTPSTFSVISPPPARTGSSERRPCRLA